jgi:hypothetical protein
MLIPHRKTDGHVSMQCVTFLWKRPLLLLSKAVTGFQCRWRTNAMLVNGDMCWCWLCFDRFDGFDVLRVGSLLVGLMVLAAWWCDACDDGMVLGVWDVWRAHSACCEWWAVSAENEYVGWYCLLVGLPGANFIRGKYILALVVSWNKYFRYFYLIIVFAIHINNLFFLFFLFLQISAWNGVLDN